MARAGRGRDARSKRRLGRPPACGGSRLKFGERDTEAREGWGDLGSASCPESLGLGTDEAPGLGPLGGGVRSPAEPKATGAAPAPGPGKHYLILGVGTGQPALGIMQLFNNLGKPPSPRRAPLA